MGGYMFNARRMMIAAVASVAGALLVPVSLPTEAYSAPQPAGEKTMSQIYRERGKADVEFQKVPPFKIFDNVWYVGPGYVSCYLITTSAGNILIDASEEPAMVQHVADSIQKAGFNLRDIKHIIISHGHIDHWGGIDRMREQPGPQGS